MPKYNIVLLQNNEVETHGSITDISRKYKDLKYSTLIRKKFPFVYKGIQFKKVPYNEVSGNINPEKQ